MMYAYRINIDHNPKTITKSIEKSLGYDGALTISLLKKLGIGDDDEFEVYEHENSREVFLRYSVSRLETKIEVKKRVAKEMKYNENYELFHARNKK